jgi:hypothetical protein
MNKIFGNNIDPALAMFVQEFEILFSINAGYSTGFLIAKSKRYNVL